MIHTVNGKPIVTHDDLMAALVENPKLPLAWDNTAKRTDEVLRASTRVMQITQDWRKPTHTPSLLEQMGAGKLSSFRGHMAMMRMEIAGGRARRNGTSVEDELAEMDRPAPTRVTVAR